MSTQHRTDKHGALM